MALGSRFEPRYARKVFPCFDVPSLKARFNIQLTIPESYTALSNTPVASAIPQNGFQTVSFETTPVISLLLYARYYIYFYFYSFRLCPPIWSPLYSES
jgi:aminopeptidase N